MVRAAPLFLPPITAPRPGGLLKGELGGDNPPSNAGRHAPRPTTEQAWRLVLTLDPT